MKKLILSVVGVFLLSTSFAFADENQIEIKYPNGGELINIGDSYKIQWDCKDYTGPVDIFLVDESNSRDLIISIVDCKREYYHWSLPLYKQLGDSYKITVNYIAGSQGVIDESDATFSIVDMQGGTVNKCGNIYRNELTDDNLGDVNLTHNTNAECVNGKWRINDAQCPYGWNYYLVNSDFTIEKYEKGECINLMTIKIPKYNWNDTKNKWVLTWKRYSVPKSSAVLTAVYKKMLGNVFDSVSIKDKTAIVKLKGGNYDTEHVNFFKQEVEQAAFQYNTVDKIKVYNYGKLVNWCNFQVAEPSESGCDKGPKYWITEKVKKETPTSTSKPVNFDVQKIMPIISLILATDNEELKNLLLTILIQIIKG